MVMAGKKNDSRKLISPWPFWTILVLAFIGGTWSAYFLIWQNLKKIEKNEAARKFAWWGVGIILMYQILLVVLAMLGNRSNNYSQVLLIGLPIWFEFKYFKKWREEHPEIKPKFQFSALGWGGLGLAATLLMWLATTVIAVKSGLIK